MNLHVNVVFKVVCLFGHQVMLHLFVLKKARLFERWLLNFKTEDTCNLQWCLCIAHATWYQCILFWC